MREGSRTDRTHRSPRSPPPRRLNMFRASIFTVIFASWLGWLNGSAAISDQPGHHLLQFHPAGDDDGDLRRRLHRPHDARLDGRGDDAAIYPHRAAEGAELLRRRRQACAAQRADRAVHRHHAAVPVASRPASSSSRRCSATRALASRWSRPPATTTSTSFSAVRWSRSSSCSSRSSSRILGYAYLNPRIRVQ